MKYDGNNAPTIPDWIEKIEDKSSGLDLLGLRNPAQKISNVFLSGITTITPMVRYLSYRAWIVWRYAEWKLPNKPQMFSSFANRVEVAFALSNLIVDNNITGVIGSNEGKNRIASGNDELELDNLVETNAYSIYTNPSAQLGISYETGNPLPSISEERGLPLAQIFDKAVSTTKFFDDLKNDPYISKISRSSLFELGKIVRLDQIPEGETNILRECVMPMQPINQIVNEKFRVATYFIILKTAESSHCTPSTDQFFDFAQATDEFSIDIIEYVRNGWLMYLARDMLAVLYESLFQFAHDHISSQPLGVSENVIVEMIISDSENQLSLLEELGIKLSREKLNNLTFRDLKTLVYNSLQLKSEKNGLVRWSGKLNELLLISLAKSNANVAILIPIAWIIIITRLEHKDQSSKRRDWSRFLSGTPGHLSFKENLLPKIEEFFHNDTPIKEVLRYVAYATIEQHFSIAWERFMNESSNVALLMREGDLLIRKSDFKAGQTQSRLHQATGWLQQLSLIDQNGITEAGIEVASKLQTMLGEVG